MSKWFLGLNFNSSPQRRKGRKDLKMIKNFPCSILSLYVFLCGLCVFAVNSNHFKRLRLIKEIKICIILK